MKLDLGCGGARREGFVGVDKRPVGDVVCDLERFPWPFRDESVEVVLASHVVEHIKPWLMIEFMDEAWRILVAGGLFRAEMPVGGSPAFWQDPTHCNGCTERTWEYFDPSHALYSVYTPKPWRLVFARTNASGILAVEMRKLALGD